MPSAKLAIIGVLLLGSQFVIARGSSPDEPALLLFGKEDHKTLLGCLNCSRFEQESVCNRFGDYGSRFNANSIWNPFGEFGSRFSNYSPWNRFASTPPVIVDTSGTFYGYFASNKFQDKRTTIKGLVVLLDNVDWVVEDLQRARDAFCES